jgi:hypothetical protein
MSKQPDKPGVNPIKRRNWYYLAVARGVDGRTKRVAWKVVFVLEGVYVLCSVIAEFAVPSLSTLGLVLLWTSLVVAVATLVWFASHHQDR